MSSDRGWRLVVPEPVRRFPADLAAVVVLTLLALLAVSLPGVRETPLRIVFGLPFVLFLPGYAFVAALFPERTAPSGSDGEGLRRIRGVRPIERIALAVGMSIVIVPVVGLALNLTPWGIRVIPIVACVSALTIGAAVVAAIRRWDRPPEERFSVPYREWLAAGRAAVFRPDDRVDAALTVALALAVVLALGSAGFAVAFPQDGEHFTEFYVLTEDDGELAAGDYPEEFMQGEPQSMIVGVENNEYEPVDYTVLIRLERVEGTDNGTEVAEREELDRFGTTLAHDETWHEERSITPTMAGENLRLTFLLYDGEVPSEPTRENAYRSLHVWIDVE